MVDRARAGDSGAVATDRRGTGNAAEPRNPWHKLAFNRAGRRALPLRRRRAGASEGDVGRYCGKARSLENGRLDGDDDIGQRHVAVFPREIFKIDEFDMRL